MENNIFTKKIIFFEDLPSTNSIVRELAIARESEGVVVVSKKQNKGRGRFNRIWESPEGGIYLSTILRPKISPEKTTLLPLVASLAVYDTIRFFKLNPKIKWPNDIRVNSKKIAGILLESDIKENKLDYVILGIGINLNTDINLFSKELRNSTTSLSNEIGSYVDEKQFLDRLLSDLNSRYKQFKDGDFKNIIRDWKENSDTICKKVKIDTSTEEITGIAKDIDEHGFLIVDTDSKNNIKISNGDCFYFDEI
jgi:BirA family biotin operon repressor/biotin-[acetyl-CoA-carboxylase] ligase